jgi:hypothetical protein
MHPEVDVKSGYYVVSVVWMAMIGSHVQPRKTEKERELCFRCMAKLRPSLDVIDGKTDAMSGD